MKFFLRMSIGYQKQSGLMIRNNYLVFIIINLLIFNSIPGICQSNTKASGIELLNQDTINENQFLYNGRIWRNLYPTIKENQFLFSKEFLAASVTMRGKTFRMSG